MISYRFTIENLWNGRSLVINDTTTDPNNYITIDTSPINDLGVRSSERNIAGQHGIKSAYSFYGGRNLAFQGKIVAESAIKMEQLEQALRAVFALPSLPDDVNDGFIRLKWSDPNGGNWQVYAKVSTGITTRDYITLKRVRDYLVQLKTESHIIQSQTTDSTSMFRSWTQGSMKLPTLLPAQLNFVTLNQTEVLVGGNYDTPAVFTIHGPAINPKITHVGKGKFIKLNLTMSGSDTVVIDVENGTIIKNGTTDISSLLTTDSNWFYLSPGTQTIAFTHEDLTPDATGIPPTEYIVVERRNALI